MGEVKPRDGLRFVRFVLIWSSLSPVFLLWAVRGIGDIGDKIWIPICTVLFLSPNLLLYLFYRLSIRSGNVKTIRIKSSRDQRDHLLTYLFAMLIPLFDANFNGYRDAISIAVAFLFIMFLFWHMNLHYMNLIFAFFGYRIFTAEVNIGTTEDDRRNNRTTTYAVISRQHYLLDNEDVTGFRIGGNVIIDEAKDD